jgi:hypothetical protein
MHALATEREYNMVFRFALLASSITMLMVVGCTKPSEETPPPAVSSSAAPIAGQDSKAPTDALGPRTAGAPGNEQPPPGMK